MTYNRFFKLHPVARGIVVCIALAIASPIFFGIMCSSALENSGQWLEERYDHPVRYEKLDK